MDVLLLATQGWEKPNITDMADAAIDGLILCFEVPLVKVGIEAYLTKDEWSELNEYGKRIFYQLVGTGKGAKEEADDLFNIVILIIITT